MEVKNQLDICVTGSTASVSQVADVTIFLLFTLTAP